MTEEEFRRFLPRIYSVEEKGFRVVVEKMTDVLRWYRDLERGSPATADLYLRRLRKFCADTGIEPDYLID